MIRGAGLAVDIFLLPNHLQQHIGLDFVGELLIMLAAQMKKAHRQFWFGVIGWSVVIVFMVIIAVQAIFNIRSGKLAGGYNYNWQPLGPGIQLSFVTAFIVCVGFTAWRHFKGRSKK